MRIVLWHGYLLAGTGSNVYSRSLARAWSKLGHEVVVLCQDPHPERYDLGGARVVRPAIGPTLPVFVVDWYEDVEARRIQDLPRSTVDAVVEANAAAIRAELPADLVFTNHVLLGAPVGVASGAPFAVKVHGSELEFTIRGDEALTRWARETLDRAQEVYAGTEHIRRSLVEILGPGDYESRVKTVPPGVDVDDFRPRPREEALAGLLAEAALDPPNPGRGGVDGHNQRLPDDGNAARLEAFLSGGGPTIVFVGRVSREKGAHLLVEAVRRLGVRTVMVGWGDVREELEAEARDLPILFTGPMEHRHLAHLFALADVSVAPSTFPEAFGMVAAEAAACGAPPLVARHTGLAEVAEGLEAEYPPDLRHLASFANGDVDDLTGKLRAILALPPARHAELRQAARRAAVDRWSWEHVADAILAGWH
ncbi:MAG: glycosyltransferase family 4 protein [Thermoleophilia bacterium]